MKISIGEVDGRQIGFDLDVLITTRLLIQANSGAGKSYLLRKLMEQLFGHIQVICIDPEGEFATLREKFGYLLVGKGGETPADVRAAAMLAEKLLELRTPAVCDLYEMKAGDRHQWVKAFLEAMVNAPKTLWHPAIVIVDEAHLFCPEKGAGDSVAKEAMTDLTTRGRKRGFCAVWATQRLAKVDKDATSMLQNRLVGGTFEDVDIKRALDLLSIPAEEKRAVTQQLRTLDPGWFYAFGRAISKTRVLFKVGQVETSHPKPGSAKHAAEPPPAPDQVKDLLPKLADLPKAAEERARTIEDLKAKIRSLTSELTAAKREKPEGPAIDSESIIRIVQDAIAQRDAAWKHQIAELHAAFRARIHDGKSAALHYIENFDKWAKLAFEDIGLDAPFEGHVSARAQQVLTANSPKGGTQGQVQLGSNVRSSTHPIAPRRAAERPSSAADAAANNGHLTRPQMNILAALAQFEAIGRSQVPKEWVAALSGASHASSSYGNNLGYLRSGGYIEYPAPAMVTLTDEGRQKAPPIDAPATAEEMLARCKEIVSGAQARILDALARHYPGAIDKDALAEMASASSTSSSYGNNLGALRSAGMIEYPEPGKAKLASWVMLEE